MVCEVYNISRGVERVGLRKIVLSFLDVACGAAFNGLQSPVFVLLTLADTAFL